MSLRCRKYKMDSKVMKKFLGLVLASMMVMVPAMEIQAQDWGRILTAGVKTIESFTISDNQIREYVGQYVKYSDQQNQLAAADNPYSVRLAKIVKGITQVDGVPLNFKVYITKDVNAFACADGSVRVYSGLMDMMNDQEVLGVIGHEIGHVANKDTKKAFQNALRTSALKDAIGSTGSLAATLTDSQLGALGETLLNSQYSQKQESNADTYSYKFLKKRGENPLWLASAFKKLDKVSGKQNAFMQAFSDHPDTQKRIKSIEKLAKKDGFKYPAATSGTTSNGVTTTKAKSAASSASKKITTGTGTTTGGETKQYKSAKDWKAYKKSKTNKQ